MIKKPFWAISLLLAILMLVACSNSNNEEKESNNLKQQVLQLQQEKVELENKVAELENQDNEQVNKVFFNESWERSIDGGDMFIEDDEYYLEHDGQIFISTQFIKDLFGIEKDDYYGIVIKGFPCESHILKTDSIIKVQDIVDDLGLEKKCEEGNYHDIEVEVEGLKIIYGEVGIWDYTFTDSTYSTERGIAIGSTRDDVKKAYGQLGSMDDEIWHTFSNNVAYSEGDAFKFVFDENDVVTGISYGWR